jgi:hypothetical protein
MGKPEFSSSEHFLPPKTLAERLKAHANGHAEIEAASFMAERFAPDLQTQAANEPERDASPESAEDTPVGGFADVAPERSSRSSGFILLAFALVALVPVIAFGALYSRGALSVTGLTAMVGDDSAKQQVSEPAEENAKPALAEAQDVKQPEMQQAAVAEMPAPETILPKRAVELPSIGLNVPNIIAIEAGKEASFAIALDSEDGLPPRSIVTIRGLPEGTSFSAGRPFGDTEWSLRPDEIDGLRVTLPAGANGQRAVNVAIVAADGSTMASTGTRLDIAPDPKMALISRPEETARIAELIEHGRKMVDVGYFPGARAYFQRAAEAGSAEAAFSVGSTYDPSFIEEIGAQGIKPDIKQARIWYERAKALGHKDADAQIKALAKAEALAATPAAPKPVEPAPTPAAIAPAAVTPKPAVAPAAPEATRTGEASPEWVEISSPVNVRSAPTPQSETIKVAVPGKRYQATARQGSWVQVTDPATSETGWVYARYVAASEAPNQ